MRCPVHIADQHCFDVGGRAGVERGIEGSDEAADVAGFGAFPGRCERLRGDGLKVPHVGWNTLECCVTPSRLLTGVASGVAVYFTHSYAARAADDAASTTEYGGRFASAVERDLIFGVQFHPEKSGVAGLRVLANFVAIAGDWSRC